MDAIARVVLETSRLLAAVIKVLSGTLSCSLELSPGAEVAIVIRNETVLKPWSWR